MFKLQIENNTKTSKKHQCYWYIFPRKRIELPLQGFRDMWIRKNVARYGGCVMNSPVRYRTIAVGGWVRGSGDSAARRTGRGGSRPKFSADRARVRRRSPPARSRGVVTCPYDDYNPTSACTLTRSHQTK